MAIILFACGIAFVLLISGDAAGANAPALRSLRTAAAAVVLLLLLGPRWMPAAGIDPRAAINGSFAVAFAIVLVMSLAARLRP